MVQPAPAPKGTKTLIIITLRGVPFDQRIYSDQKADDLVAAMKGDEDIGFAFKDIIGSWFMVNIKEVISIEFIPQDSQ